MQMMKPLDINGISSAILFFNLYLIYPNAGSGSLALGQGNGAICEL